MTRNDLSVDVITNRGREISFWEPARARDAIDEAEELVSSFLVKGVGFTPDYWSTDGGQVDELGVVVPHEEDHHVLEITGDGEIVEVFDEERLLVSDEALPSLVADLHNVLEYQRLREAVRVTKLNLEASIDHARRHIAPVMEVIEELEAVIAMFPDGCSDSSAVQSNG